MNSDPHKCVYCSQIDINMERFTWAKLDIHLVYSAVYDNGREAQRIYNECFPNKACPEYNTFASVNHRLWETGTFAVNRHSTE